MYEFIITFIIGIIFIPIGISNMKGNLSTLHSYHRKRVSEEDRIPFGKEVGRGMIIVGIAIMIYSALSAAALHFNANLYSVIGTVILVAGLVVGLGFAFHAMFKYNQGLF